MLLVPLLCLLALLGAWVLLPLVPAILIYKLFPNTQVTARGPLAGLTVKAGGAFAAYLIIFLATSWLVNVTKDNIGAMMTPSWTVLGEVKLVDHNGSTVPRRDLLEKMELGSIPNPLHHDSEMLSLVIPQDNTRDFPKIVITVPEWGSRDVNLNEQRKRDLFKHQITLGEIKIPQRQPALIYPSQAPMER